MRYRIVQAIAEFLVSFIARQHADSAIYTISVRPSVRLFVHHVVVLYLN